VIGHVRRQREDAGGFRRANWTPVIRWQADPHRRRTSAEERKRRGGNAHPATELAQ
jgi:hypothetical protein